MKYILNGIRYKQHRNPDGSLGGLVATTAHVADTVHVGFLCRVFGAARLSGKVRLTGEAQVGGTVIASAGVFAQNAYVIRGVYDKSNRIITEQQLEE